VRWGYGRADLAERLLSGVYDRVMVRGREGHPVERYRAEVAQVIAGTVANGETVLAEPGAELPDPSSPPVFSYRPFAPPAPDVARILDEGGSPFILLFPFASGSDKAIPAEISCALIAQAHTRGLRVLIPSGSDAEVAQARELLNAPQVQMLPRLSIPQLMAVMARARAFVGADTGLTHIAASLGLPVAAVFRITDPDHLGPHLWAAHAQSFRLAPALSDADRDDLAARIAAMWPCSNLAKSGASGRSQRGEGT
jgi:heptosyltransferase-1